MAPKKPKQPKLSPNDKEWWTPKRRKEHSKRMEEWRLDHEVPGYYDPKKKDWIDGDWTPEFRAKQSKIIKEVWRKRSKAEKERISNKLRLHHMEVRFANLNGRKPPYKWVLEFRRLRGLAGS
jgi:hypothetical protein